MTDTGKHTPQMGTCDYVRMLPHEKDYHCENWQPVAAPASEVPAPSFVNVVRHIMSCGVEDSTAKRVLLRLQNEGIVRFTSNWTVEVPAQPEQEQAVREWHRLSGEVGWTDRQVAACVESEMAQLREALTIHWITGIECDHDTKRDYSTCACGLWTSNNEPSIGAAVKAWVEHVFEEAALSDASSTPPAGTSEQK